MTIVTERLYIRQAIADDAPLFVEIWNSPEIMKNVGFPNGLGADLDSMRDMLNSQGDGLLDRMLVACIKGSDIPIGECYMHSPDEDKIATTDIKLLPRYQGCGYGVEIKTAILNYLFDNTDCEAVEATPNIGNNASIRMQEKVGGIRIDRRIHHFEADYTSPARTLEYFVYHVKRESRSK